jgi:hypothetical protein
MYKNRLPNGQPIFFNQQYGYINKQYSQSYQAQQ